MWIKGSSKIVVALVVLVAGVGLALSVRIAWATSPAKGGGEGAASPPEVAVVTVQSEKITLTTELPGRTAAYLVAEVRPQVNGIIQKRLFVEGTIIKEGEILYEIDRAPYQAAYDLAVAAVARAEANATPIELLAQRQKDLVPTGAVSQQDYDQVVANLKQAKAEIEYSKASLKTAKVNLAYTRVTAPISGRIGKSNVTVGALATAHQGLSFATIQQLDPIYVDVPQSTAQLQRLESRLKEGQLSHDGTDVKKVGLVLEDGTEYPCEGTLQFRDVTVEQSTGSVILRILFPNPEQVLLPGMFVRAIVTEGVNERALMVSQQAVSRNVKGEPFVLVVNEEGKAEQRMVKLDRTIDDRWLVSEGIAEGDTVIVEGLQRVRPGAAVRAVSWVEKQAQSLAETQSSSATEKS